MNDMNDQLANNIQPNDEYTCSGRYKESTRYDVAITLIQITESVVPTNMSLNWVLISIVIQL